MPFPNRSTRPAVGSTHHIGLASFNPHKHLVDSTHNIGSARSNPHKTPRSGRLDPSRRISSFQPGETTRSGRLNPWHRISPFRPAQTPRLGRIDPSSRVNRDWAFLNTGWAAHINNYSISATNRNNWNYYEAPTESTMERREETEELTWNRETVPKVLRIGLDFREMNNTGNRLILALSLPRYQHIKQINLEFAQDIEDKHLELIKNKCQDSLQKLESLNLNGCQKISDKGIETITSACPNLKNISDKDLQLVAEHYPELESLNLTRCVKLTDNGLKKILLKCSSLQNLNLYALSSLSDETYKNISLLRHLKYLDLCGAQNLSDEGLSSIAKCNSLVSLNLTWCIRVTDAGFIAITEACSSLELLSLFGIVGVTDKCLEALSRICSHTLTTLDVNGCIGIKDPTVSSPKLQGFSSLLDDHIY
ncbi:hypothetical protein TIFTF001_025062 [Ficus carica]|uniref:F-box/LRR-repeat protein 15-like leucin rich repeat domain-containing protein n=1 Tax=Ficus carica TaxID=3494 RepID=A0AA88DGE8_FICCA|nr:hypothetical protein TIFTF001_025062 [Ficus carica]